MRLKSVLVVDDDPGLLGSLSDMLSMLGSERVIATTNAREALELARRDPPELAFIDIFLEDDCGLELIKKLRAEFPTLAIGAISGHFTCELAMETIRASATWFLSKPFGIASLREAIVRGGAPPSPPTALQERRLPMEAAKRAHVKQVLAMTNGNKSAAARLLQIPRQSLQRMLKQLGSDVASDGDNVDAPDEPPSRRGSSSRRR